MSQANDLKKDDKKNKDVAQNDTPRKDDAPQLGHFLDYDRHWLQGLELLKYQLHQLKEPRKRKPHKHFTTLDMCYYAKLEHSFPNLEKKDYFLTRIANNRFYGLSKEFTVLPYTIPKSHLGLRKYKFMTCPMRVLYYAIGVYLLELSNEYLQDYKCHKQIDSWYGGDLIFNGKELNLESTDRIHYKSRYKTYRRRLRKETRQNTERKVVFRLDIENYFDELRIPTLLALLEERVKPSIQREMNYDETTQSQLVSFFEFVAGGMSGIPQQNNDVISSFIGHLFLVFGDSFINDKLLQYNDSAESYSIIRYVDDINISLTFKGQPSDLGGNQSLLNLRNEFNALVPRISDCLYENLGLRLNPKTRIYRLSEKKDRKALEQSLKKVSQEIQIPDDENQESTNKKIRKILNELRKLKRSHLAPYFLMSRKFDNEEILKEAYDNDVRRRLVKSYKGHLRRIFIAGGGFDFHLVNADPTPIIIMILICDDVKVKFEEFLSSKTDLTSRDISLALNYLCQTEFTQLQLLALLKCCPQMTEIIEIFEKGELSPELTGYYELTDEQASIICQPNIIEQIRLRVLAEQKEDFSVALNHLLNEIHAICGEFDEKSKNARRYDALRVSVFLKSRNVPHKTYTQIRNLFDRRNKTLVSHADPIAWAVAKDEYEGYRFHVGKCLKHILP